MTAPRQILPGRTFMITRRTTQRQFLLLPREDVAEIIAYCLAEAAAREQIELIAWLVMSNHYHAIVRDPLGRLPAFLEHFHKMVARVLNAKWGRNENLWSSEETAVTYLPTPADVFDKVVYVLCNPAAAHLVDSVSEWPGCSSLRNMGGKTTVHQRPSFFFRPSGKMPPNASLTAACPADIRGSESVADWTARVLTAVEKRERSLRENRTRANVKVLGREAVLGAATTDRPHTREALRSLKPCVACKDPLRRTAELVALKEFRIAHDRARLRFVAGERHVEFPAGTWRMRAWGAHCEPYPAAIAA